MSKCAALSAKLPKAIINFGAGPAKLPETVLQEIQQDLLSVDANGCSVLEFHHRSDSFIKLNNRVVSLAKELLQIDDNYDVLFMHGGGQGLLSAIPMNLMSRTGTADYIVTGFWSEKAAKEGAKYGKVNMVLPPQAKYKDIPPKSMWKLDPNASYVYYCDNETVDGVEFTTIPETNGVPLVTDMASNIMTKRLDVSKYGLIHATAHKNIGTSGVNFVVIKKDLLGKPLDICPPIWDFSMLSQYNSVVNTPPIFPIYVMGLVFQWIKDKGGVEEMDKVAQRKSNMVYDVISSSSGFYSCPMIRSARSRINIPFRLDGGNERLEESFLNEAQENGICNIKGHKVRGGIRVSLFNSITVEHVGRLIEFMTKFYNANKV